MSKALNSFKVYSGGKTLDYRLGEKLNLEEIKIFFQNRFEVIRIWDGNRHILAILTRNRKKFFLKLATSEGISVVTENEYSWNKYFQKYFHNSNYRVPKNYESGLYKNKYFYIITDYFEGELLSKISDTPKDTNSLKRYIPSVIEFSHLIAQLPIISFTNFNIEQNFKKRFVDKATNWFIDIPEEIREGYKIRILLDIVGKGAPKLLSKPRHGDFTPWHIIKLNNSKLGLIDGEHAQADSVEGYDICYFIQRVFAVLKNPAVAKRIYLQLVENKYSQDKLRTVLCARAIGGFLDESLRDKPDYRLALKFNNWVIGS